MEEIKQMYILCVSFFHWHFSFFDYRSGDANRNITILKVDIEGEEMWSIPQVLETELLIHIKQIHIEVRISD